MDWYTDPTRRHDRENPGLGDRHITLWCRACGRPRYFTRAELAGYLELDWPECCGRPIDFFPGTLRGANNPAG